MKPLIHSGFQAAAAALLFATAAAAQEPPSCPDTATVGSCFSSGVPELAAMRVELNEKPTGTAEPGGGNPTAIADYLPRLAAALFAPGLTEDLPTLSFSTNVPLNDGALLDLGMTLQAALSLNDPEVFPALLDTVPETLREGVRGRLEKDFHEFSDPQITLSINAENRRFGRSLRQHSGELSEVLNTIYDEAAGTLSAEQGDALRQLHDLLGGFQRFIASGEASNPRCQGAAASRIALACFEPAYRRQLESQIAAASAAFRAQHLELRRRIEAEGVPRIADLLNNQPQVNAAFEWHPRDQAVGPPSFTLRLRGEWSPANLNGARRACGGRIQGGCLATYVRAPSVQRSLRRGDRLWATVDVTRTGTYTAPLLPADSATLSLPSGWRVEPALGFGWYISAPQAAPQRARLDLQLSGSFQETDGVRTPSRILVSANYSLRMGDNVVGTAGLVWANQSEFLGDDVTPLGARFGVRYKLPSGQ